MGSYVKNEREFIRGKFENKQNRVSSQIVAPFTTFPRKAVPKNNLKFIGPDHIHTPA
jgi:hypothetical protein